MARKKNESSPKPQPPPPPLSPLEYIEQGIGQGDWGMVCDGYRLLTGKTLSPPTLSLQENSEVRPSPDLLARCLRAISEVFGQGEPHEPPPNKSEEEEEKNILPISRPERGSGAKARANTNEFTDDGKDCQDSLRIDQILLQGLKPGPRRSPPVKRKVKCSRCDRQEVVDAILAPHKLDKDDETHYVCNRCLSKSARR